MGSQKIGYRHPPPSGRWKPGQSGNPGGRKKRTKTVGTIIDETLLRKVTVEEDGRRVTLSLQELILHQLANAAAGGDMNAIKTLFALRDRYDDSSETNLDPAELEPDDRAIIEDYLARIQAAAPTSTEKPPAACEAPNGESLTKPNSSEGDAS